MSTTSPGTYLTLLPVPEETMTSLNPTKNVTQAGALGKLIHISPFAPSPRSLPSLKKRIIARCEDPLDLPRPNILLTYFHQI